VSEDGIVVQDRSFEPLKLLGRFQAFLVDHCASARPVGVERVRLSTGAVEGQHQLPAQSLAQRVGSDKLFEVCNQLTVASQRHC
jgi:hypothetical protein